MSKQLKAVPKFTNEAEEQVFWEAHDSTDYLDWSKAQRVVLLNLADDKNDFPAIAPASS